MNPLLSLSEVSVYRGRSPVVRGVSLTLREGEAVALMGRNGSGRTTLLEGIAGLHRREGTVTLGGETLPAASPGGILRRGVALCPSDRGLFPDMTVWENLILGGYVLPRTQAEERARDVLASVPLLAERKTQRAGTLSGGEQQLLAVARAWISRPRVLLLDQPTAGQAPRYRRHVADIVRQVTHGRAGAVLLAEDDLEFCLSVADRVVAISDGRLAFDVPVSGDLLPSHLLDRLLLFEQAPRLPGQARGPAAAHHPVEPE
jgi:branched-chain amino acid transport system ATP-binding protein